MFNRVSDYLFKNYRIWGLVTLALIPLFCQSGWIREHVAIPDQGPLELELSLDSIQMEGLGILFQLRFYNRSNREIQIVLPGPYDRGTKLIRLVRYERDGFEQPLYEETVEVGIVRNDTSYATIKQLGPGTSVCVPLVAFSGPVRYTELDHDLKLVGQPCIIQAIYEPWESDFAGYCFTLPSDTAQPLNERSLSLPKEGLRSNGVSWDPSVRPLADLPDHCAFCTWVHEGNWSMVEQEIARRSESGEPWVDWVRSHPAVVHLYHGPDAVLASLPTYYGRRIVFRNRSGYHFFYLYWQWGKIYRGRSRFRSILQWLFHWDAPIRTDDIDAVELLWMRSY